MECERTHVRLWVSQHARNPPDAPSRQAAGGALQARRAVGPRVVGVAWASVPECHQRIDQEACATDNSVECASVLFKLLAGPFRSRSARTAHSVSGFLSLSLPTAAGKRSRPSPGGATTKTA